MRTIFFVFISFCFGCSGLPEGAMTIIETKVVEKSTGKPLSNYPILLQKCEPNLGWGGSFCFDVDTLVSDLNAEINYGFFHESGGELSNSYQLIGWFNGNRTEIRIQNGHHFKEPIEL